MINYDKTNFLQTLCRRSYNLINNKQVLLFPMFNVLLTYVVVSIDQNVDEFKLEESKESLNTTLSIFNFFLLFTLSFRMNNSYNSWKSGNEKSNKLILLVKRFASILSTKVYEFSLMNALERTIILYTSYTFYMCSECKNLLNGDDELNNEECFIEDIDSLNTIKKQEMKLYIGTDKKTLENVVPNTTILVLIENDLRLQLASFKHKEYITDLDEMSLNGLINEISNNANDIINMANIPVVLIYNQFINISIISYMILYILNISITSGYYAGIWVFLWSVVIFVANHVCNQIDTPFGQEENDIDLKALLYQLRFDIKVAISG